MNEMIEYLNIHLISLNQDLESNEDPHLKINLKGQIQATEHLLSVAEDILNK